MNVFYSALLMPFYPYKYTGKKDKKEKVIMKVMHDSLKKSHEEIRFVMTTLSHVRKMIHTVKFAENKGWTLDNEVKI